MSIPHRPRFSLLLLALLVTGAFWQGLYAPAQQVLPAVLLAVATLGLLARQSGSQEAPGAPGGFPGAGNHQPGSVRPLPAPGPVGLPPSPGPVGLPPAPGLPITTSEGVALMTLLITSLLATLGPVAGLWDPVSPGVAAHGPVVVGGWLLAWGLGRGLSSQPGVARSLVLALAVAGFLMTLAGLAGLPWLPLHRSGRLASFLGYPIATGILGLLGVLGSLPPLAAGRWWAGLLLWGNGLGLWLSGSRAVWAVALLCAVWLGWKRPGLLRRAWLPLLLALVAALWLAPAVATRRLTWWPDATYLLGQVVLRPSSGLERAVLIQDGLAMVRDYPLGAGYRAWTALHLQYASYGYYAAEVHSAPLDLAIAFGWAGAAAYLWLLVQFLSRLPGRFPGRFPPGRFPGRRPVGAHWGDEPLVLMTGLAALALHSLVDWELSYGFFAYLLWFGFGLAGAAPQGAPAAPETAPGAVPRPQPLPAEPTAPPAIHRPQAGRWLPWPALAALAGLTLAGGLLLGSAGLAAAAGRAALARGQPETAYRHAQLAATLAPWDDTAHALLGRALLAMNRPAEAGTALARARSLGPREPAYAEWHGQALAAAGRSVEAAAAYREMVRLWPWRVQVYEAALEAQQTLALRLQVQGRTAEARTVADLARAVLADLERQKAREPAWTPRQPLNTQTPILQQVRAWLGE